MSKYPEISTFSVGIHAMPCTNRCQHCWTQGSVNNKRVPAEQVCFVLDKLAQVQPEIDLVGFYLYDEPTNHPQFLQILEHATNLGLMGPEFFLPTNGSILAKASDETWRKLKETGFNYLQLTLYGLEETHDRFAGRRGAFRNIVTTTERAAKHNIEWYAGVVLHPGNVSELEETISYIKRLDPTGKTRVGWYPFLWQGRGRDSNRVRVTEYLQLPEKMRNRRTTLVQEKEAIRQITNIPGLAGRLASDGLCAALNFHVDRNLRVYCGGNCDSGGIADAAPEIREKFYLGTLDEGGFAPLLDTYLNQPPKSVQLLDEITWGELAVKYGDKNNDEIYSLSDLPMNKWSAAYLLDEFAV